MERGDEEGSHQNPSPTHHLKRWYELFLLSNENVARVKYLSKSTVTDRKWEGFGFGFGFG